MTAKTSGERATLFLLMNSTIIKNKIHLAPAILGFEVSLPS